MGITQEIIEANKNTLTNVQGIWFQNELIDDDAVKLGRDNSLCMIQNKCIQQEMNRWKIKDVIAL